MMGEKKICVEKDQRTFNDGDMDQEKVVINSLDYDCLAKIIMLLPIPERIDMEKVCTKWKRACKLAWYDIKKYKCESSIGRSYIDNRFLTQAYLEKILLRCGICLKELSLSNICNTSIMPFVGDHCTNLTSLECEFDVKPLITNANHFVQAFTQLDKLKCIKIRVKHNNFNKTINLFKIIDRLPKEITEIQLYFKAPFCHEGTVFLTIKKFKNLQKLTVHGLSLDNINFLEVARKTTLVHLNIELYNIPEEISLFNKLVNLEYIDLRMIRSTKELNTIFCTCKNLKHLDIPYGIYDVAKIPLKNWKNFRNLEYLGISCQITPDLANTIVEYCTNLKHLRISNPDRVTNENIFEKLTELVNLECLILLGYVPLKKESIIAIAKNCKLKRLEIPCCTIVPSIDSDPLSSPSVSDEISKLQHLEYLDLSEAKNLEDSTIIAIANNCKSLKSFLIRGCSAITETAVVALINLKNLQKLDISCCDITDDFIIRLKGLKELLCNGCEKLSDAGICQFIKNNPDLGMISVVGIDNITINMVIAADQTTKNRTNSVILHS